jgi:hypothetical protein
MKKVVVLRENSSHFVNLLSSAKRLHKNDYSLSLTHESNLSQVSPASFIKKSDLYPPIHPTVSVFGIAAQLCSIRFMLKFPVFLNVSIEVS